MQTLRQKNRIIRLIRLIHRFSFIRGGGVSFFISVAYLRQFTPFSFHSAVLPLSFHSAFPFLYPPSLADWKCRFPFALLSSPLLCPLRRDLIPTYHPSKSPFRPENLIILTFSSPKICTYQKFCVSLHPISGSPLIH